MKTCEERIQKLIKQFEKLQRDYPAVKLIVSTDKGKGTFIIEDTFIDHHPNQFDVLLDLGKDSEE